MYKKTLDMVHTEIDQEVESSSASKRIRFDSKIQLRNISFLYPEAETKSLDNVKLDIQKGDKIVLIGESGSGKSTLMDILIGLHLPSSLMISRHYNLLEKQYFIYSTKSGII